MNKTQCYLDTKYDCIVKQAKPLAPLSRRLELLTAFQFHVRSTTLSCIACIHARRFREKYYSARCRFHQAKGDQ
jgi:hypothetical protein